MADGRQQTSVSGLLRDIWSNTADFGVSALEVTEERKQYVDFTDPILNYSISALIADENVGHIRTLHDLADQTRVAYGSMRNTTAMNLFARSNDMVLARIFALMNSSRTTVATLDEAMQRVKTSRWAFIGDSYVVDQMARSGCGLTVIRDNRPYFQRQMALALLRRSKYLDLFNKFIKQLVKRGTIDEIQGRYWHPVACERSYARSQARPLVISLFPLIILLAVSQLIFWDGSLITM